MSGAISKFMSGGQPRDTELEKELNDDIKNNETTRFKKRKLDLKNIKIQLRMLFDSFRQEVVLPKISDMFKTRD